MIPFHRSGAKGSEAEQQDGHPELPLERIEAESNPIHGPIELTKSFASNPGLLQVTANSGGVKEAPGEKSDGESKPHDTDEPGDTPC